MGANKSKEVKINEDTDDTSFHVDSVSPKKMITSQLVIIEKDFIVL